MAGDLPEPVARLLAAANDHDTDAFLASFTEDGVVDDWGREFVGPAAIVAGAIASSSASKSRSR